MKENNVVVDQFWTNCLHLKCILKLLDPNTTHCFSARCPKHTTLFLPEKPLRSLQSSRCCEMFRTGCRLKLYTIMQIIPSCPHYFRSIFRCPQHHNDPFVASQRSVLVIIKLTKHLVPLRFRCGSCK